MEASPKRVLTRARPSTEPDAAPPPQARRRAKSPTVTSKRPPPPFKTTQTAKRRRGTRAPPPVSGDDAARPEPAKRVRKTGDHARSARMRRRCDDDGGSDAPRAADDACCCDLCRAVRRSTAAARGVGAPGPAVRDYGPPQQDETLVDDDCARCRTWRPGPKASAPRTSSAAAAAARGTDESTSAAREETVHKEIAARGRAFRSDRRALVRNGASDSSDSFGGGIYAEAARLKLRFGRSQIHLWGVFADQPIRAGELVLEYRGELVGNAVVEKRALAYEAARVIDYMFRVDDRQTCDATTRGALARFVNHSCAPNCVSRIVIIEKRKKIALYAKRDIRADEELCYDYKFTIEEIKIPCRCGAPTCRGALN
mmetsp:Transcript_8796/g.30277  ORF Transcript_8796/g.30277 Transcript_8796/m.30277 type:complete len:370 (-) Transcript_8796:155-1264(-)